MVVAFCSDGSSANGIWHESLNLAAIWDLPVIFVLENNQYAVSTPIRDSARVARLSDRAAAYGMPGVTVDGNDAALVSRGDAGAASARPRRRGPVADRVHDLPPRRPPRERPGALPAEGRAGALEGARPAARAPRSGSRRRGSTRRAIAAIDAEVERQIDEAVEFAEASPEPSVEAFLAEVDTL